LKSAFNRQNYHVYIESMLKSWTEYINPWNPKLLWILLRIQFVPQRKHHTFLLQRLSGKSGHT